MADVLFIFVREDAACAEALADVFTDVGLSVSDDPNEAHGATLVLWSRAAVRTRAFIERARTVMLGGRAISVALTAGLDATVEGAAAMFDLSRWNGDPNDAAVDPLFCAIDRLVMSAQVGASAVVATVVESEESDETPESEDPFFGPSKADQWPPRDRFRRVQPKAPPRGGARLLAIAALAAGAMFTAGFSLNKTPTAIVHIETGGMTLASAAAEAIGLADTPAPGEADQGRRGLEPPSAS
jgi:hypothetical protein